MPTKREVSGTKRNKKALLLSTARRIVADGGFQDLQMATVANAAGMAVGTIYRYFPSKMQLCVELVSLASQREVDVLAGVALSEGAPEQKLGDAIRAFVGRAMQAPRLAYAMIVEPVFPEVELARHTYDRKICKVLESILLEGIRDGVFREMDVEISAACMFGAFHEGLVGPLAPEATSLPDHVPDLIDSMVEFCLASVLKFDRSQILQTTQQTAPNVQVLKRVSHEEKK